MRYGARRQRGVVKVDEIVFEKGKYPIKLDKNSGKFITLIADKELTDKNLEVLKSKALDMLKQMSKNKAWEAVIDIKLEANSYGYKSYSFHFDRYFRCKLPNGTWLFRSFKGSDDRTTPEALKAVLGEATNKARYSYPDKNHIYIPYSPEAWKGCIRIQKFSDDLDKLIFETLNQTAKAKLSEKFAELAKAEVHFLFPMTKRKGK